MAGDSDSIDKPTAQTPGARPAPAWSGVAAGAYSGADSPPDAPFGRSGHGAAADDLPLVVWLRGDEPYCDAFCLDAEAVMQQLGIRRSRLTQISGRELRVGRIRKGRYVAPVYRPEDVDTYQSWSRATASHLKSSSVLTEAADGLREQAQTLYRQVEATVGSIVGSVDHIVDQQLRAGIASMTRFTAEELAAVHGQLRRLGADTAFVTASQQRQVAQQQQALAANATTAASHAAALTLVMRDLAALAALVRVNREDMLAQEAARSVWQAQISDAVSALAAATLSAQAAVPAAEPASAATSLRPRPSRARQRCLYRQTKRAADAAAAAPRSPALRSKPGIGSATARLRRGR